MTNRVHIDAPAGVVEIEGEKDFVEGLLAKLFPLLEEAGFGSSPPKNSDVQPPGEAAAGPDEEIPEENGGSGKSKTKRKRSVAPKGHSCADRILALKEEGFFKTKRGGSDIVAGLAEKGFTHKSNQVAAAGESLFTRGLLQRTKEGSGPFKYFWDRD
ncbi:hypothetical protein LZK98_12300 [Sphingomonas cannabina]|uniref:hypothetical protein n=1 Tax=Sphingomonas cannabina TaxID=2899123 RepID=UPI001F4590F7|nr:hypothetical protein [Sphingomonas cannabina]UIJ43872.1 hypothetical protein LZK98_12300 [Sphingomonas cannabina]